MSREFSAYRLEHARGRNKIALHQSGVGFFLFPQIAQRSVRRRQLLGQVDDFGLCLATLFGHFLNLFLHQCIARTEVAFFALQDALQVRIVLAGQQRRREANPGRVVDFRLQARELGQFGVELVVDDRQRGAGFGIFELDDRLSSADVLTVLDQDAAHDAAFEVLHQLGIRFHFHHALRDDRARERSQRRPKAADAEGQPKSNCSHAH